MLQVEGIQRADDALRQTIGQQPRQRLSVVFYNDYAVQYRSELKSEALSMAHAINGGLAEEDYLRSLEQDKISPIRITWIGADGAVRYDNKADPAQMGNHAARTEVADALRYGAGESERYSATLSQKTFYYACRLQDGTVLRLAGTRDGSPRRGPSRSGRLLRRASGAGSGYGRPRCGSRRQIHSPRCSKAAGHA